MAPKQVQGPKEILLDGRVYDVSSFRHPGTIERRVVERHKDEESAPVAVFPDFWPRGHGRGYVID